MGERIMLSRRNASALLILAVACHRGDSTASAATDSGALTSLTGDTVATVPGEPISQGESFHAALADPKLRERQLKEAREARDKRWSALQAKFAKRGAHGLLAAGAKAETEQNWKDCLDASTTLLVHHSGDE